jgi:hypothetical protein
MVRKLYHMDFLLNWEGGRSIKNAAETIVFPKGHTCPVHKCWVGAMQATEEAAHPLILYFSYLAGGHFMQFTGSEFEQ